MKIKDFGVEMWMNAYENDCTYNLAETCVESLTVEQMREHGYDVTEQDAGVIDRIAEKVEVDADMLWNGVAVWADTYGIKSHEEY